MEFKSSWSSWTPPILKFRQWGFQNWFCCFCNSNKKEVPSGKTFFLQNGSKLANRARQNQVFHLITTLYSFTCYANPRRFGSAPVGGLVIDRVKNKLFFGKLNYVLGLSWIIKGIPSLIWTISQKCVAEEIKKDLYSIVIAL